MKEIVEDVPKPAIRWGVAGLIPYAGTSLAIVHFARQAKLAVENGGGSRRRSMWLSLAGKTAAPWSSASSD